MGIIFIVIALMMPSVFGAPISGRQTVHFMVSANLLDDCEVKRSFQLMRRVYERRGYSFSATRLKDRIPVQCPISPVSIYLVPYIGGDAGASKPLENDGCRVIGIDPEHVDFSKRTLAHEFGHEWFGEVGLPRLLAPILNPLYDFRTDVFVRLSI
jgi:hypothetical protein